MLPYTVDQVKYLHMLVDIFIPLYRHQQIRLYPHWHHMRVCPLTWSSILSLIFAPSWIAGTPPSNLIRATHSIVKVPALEQCQPLYRSQFLPSLKSHPPSEHRPGSTEPGDRHNKRPCTGDPTRHVSTATHSPSRRHHPDRSATGCGGAPLAR